MTPEKIYFTFRTDVSGSTLIDKASPEPFVGSVEYARAHGWQPIEMITPIKWRYFLGRQIGRSVIGCFVVFCPTTLFLGAELIRGQSRGIGFGLGPFWIGFAILIPAAPEGEGL